MVQRFERAEVHLRALRPIKEGEELCTTYQALHDPSFDRRRHLVNHFYFDNRPDVRVPGSASLRVFVCVCQIDRTNRQHIVIRTCLCVCVCYKVDSKSVCVCVLN